MKRAVGASSAAWHIGLDPLGSEACRSLWLVSFFSRGSRGSRLRIRVFLLIETTRGPECGRPGRSDVNEGRASRNIGSPRKCGGFCARDGRTPDETLVQLLTAAALVARSFNVAGFKPSAEAWRVSLPVRSPAPTTTRHLPLKAWR